MENNPKLRGKKILGNVWERLSPENKKHILKWVNIYRAHDGKHKLTMAELPFLTYDQLHLYGFMHFDDLLNE